MAGAGGGTGRAGGSSGGVEPPEIDFNRILARLVRYFGQSPHYWLDHGTLQDWRNIYSRELIENPPTDYFIAGYFKYEAPADAGTSSASSTDDDDEELWECPFPEVTE